MVFIEDYIKSKLVLENYIKNYAKSFGEVSGDSYDSEVPYHPAVTDLNADSKELAVGSAMYFRHWCERTVYRMFKAGFDTEATILKRKYLQVRPYNDFQQQMRLSCGANKFYKLQRKALLLFSDVCPTFIFNELFNKVFDKSRNRVDVE